jgi:hypothetical protein
VGTVCSLRSSPFPSTQHEAVLALPRRSFWRRGSLDYFIYYNPSWSTNCYISYHIPILCMCVFTVFESRLDANALVKQVPTSCLIVYSSIHYYPCNYTGRPRLVLPVLSVWQTAWRHNERTARLVDAWLTDRDVDSSLNYGRFSILVMQACAIQHNKCAHKRRSNTCI